MDRTDYVMIDDRLDSADDLLYCAMDCAADAGDEELRRAIEGLRDDLNRVTEMVRNKKDSFPAPEFEYEYTFHFNYRVTGKITSPYSREAIEYESLEALAMECEEKLWEGATNNPPMDMDSWDCDDVRKVPVREVRE